MRSFLGSSVILSFYRRGSISKVMGNEKLGISASYDALMIIWDLKKK